MHSDLFSLILLASAVSFSLSCEGALEDYGGDKSQYWKGENRMKSTSESDATCYRAHLEDKYHHHMYYFDATVCADKSVFFNISTPHGRSDRFFKINYNDKNGKQLKSFSSRADCPQGCRHENIIKRDNIDHITVQEWKIQITNCIAWIFFCTVWNTPVD